MKRISRINLVSDLDLSSLDRFIGMSCAEINSELDLKVSMTGKSYVRTIIDKMLVEFDIKLDPPRYEHKMIRVDSFGRAMNGTPLKVTDYQKIVHEKWEDSDFKKLLEPTHVFLVVTHGTPETSIFKGYVVYDFSNEDMKSAEEVWTDTRDKIRNGVYDRFLTDKDTGTFFFKMHTINVSRRVEAPSGEQEVPRSFWISKSLISRIVSNL